MFSLKDVKYEGMRNLLGNKSLSAGGLAIHGTNKENVLTAAIVTFTITCVFYTKAATAEVDLSALAVLEEDGDADTIDALSAGYTRVFLLVMNAAGTMKIVQGTDVANGGSAYSPACPDGHAPFGAIKVVNGSGSAFTLGTTALDAADITSTFKDLSHVPATAL